MQRLFLVLMTCVLAGIGWAQPALDAGGVVNAASYTNPRLSTGKIARGSMFIAFGRNLGPAVVTFQGAYPLVRELAGVSLRVNVAGVTRDAIPVYVAAGQVAAILPSNTPEGEATLTLTRDGQSTSTTFTVVGRQWGSFSTTQQGFGPAVLFNYESPTSQPLNSMLNSAKHGQVVTLWGTGLGPIDQDETLAPVPGDQKSGIRVVVGGVDAVVEYAGRGGASAGAGIDQINFRAPRLTGCWIPVHVVIDGRMSKQTTMAITADGGNCEDENWILRPSAIPIIAQGGLTLADVRYRRSGNYTPGIPTPEVISDGYFVTFLGYPWARYQEAALVQPYGSCQVTMKRWGDPTFAGSIFGFPAGSVSAGVAGGNMTTFPAQATPGIHDVNYTAGAFFLAGRTYRVAATGDPNGPGAFQVDLQIPEDFTWNERNSLPNTVSRSTPLTLSWSGAVGRDVYVFGRAPYFFEGASDLQTEFSCRVPGEAGTFTVPVEVLQAILPTSDRVAGVGGARVGMAADTRPQPFSVPNFGVGNAHYYREIYRTVNFQ